MAKFKSAFLFSGAGLSQESGVKTFRDNNGLWENHRVEDVATPEAFERDPELVYRFYNLRRQQLGEVEPNEAHRAMARFQKEFSGETLIVTQNVDDLLERAGCEDVLQMHGELQKMRCSRTGKVFFAPPEFDASSQCSCCHETGRLRPHIVWFGEVPFYMSEIEAAIERCDVFLSVGTSNQVYPAASFVQFAKARGVHCIEVNFEETALSHIFDENHYGKAGEVLPRVLSRLLT